MYGAKDGLLSLWIMVIDRVMYWEGTFSNRLSQPMGLHTN